MKKFRSGLLALGFVLSMVGTPSLTLQQGDVACLDGACGTPGYEGGEPRKPRCTTCPVITPRKANG
jgi:hypothetical protein